MTGRANQTTNRDPQPGGPIRDIANGLSVDIADWFRVGGSNGTISRQEWDHLNDRVADNTDRLLDLFADHGVTATFFVQGGLAQRRPDVVRKIADAGHEIASHGNDHARIANFDAITFARDITMSRARLQDVSGRAVTGYRAPSFSINRSTAWAYEELARAGFTYSSSVVPITHRHVGWSDAPTTAFLPIAGSPFVELPLNTATIGRTRIAAGSGSVFRTLPYGLTRWAIRQANRVDRRPAIIQIVPDEIDPAPPPAPNLWMISDAGRRSRNSSTASRLASFVGAFRWHPLLKVAQAEVEGATAAAPPRGINVAA